MEPRHIIAFVIACICGGGLITFYESNVTVSSEPALGVVVSYGTAGGKYANNNPIVTVQLPSGRTVEVWYPQLEPLPSIRQVLKLKRDLKRWAGDSFELAG